MTRFDLGFWSGVMFAAVPGIKVYREFGMLAGVGAYIASAVILGVLVGVLLMFNGGKKKEE